VVKKLFDLDLEAGISRHDVTLYPGWLAGWLPGWLEHRQSAIGGIGNPRKTIKTKKNIGF